MGSAHVGPTDAIVRPCLRDEMNFHVTELLMNNLEMQLWFPDFVSRVYFLKAQLSVYLGVWTIWQILCLIVNV